MTEDKKPEPKKKSKAVTSALGEKLMGELEAAAKLTGESQAELVRCVFEQHAPTAKLIASSHMERKIKEQREKLAGLTAAYEAMTGSNLA